MYLLISQTSSCLASIILYVDKMKEKYYPKESRLEYLPPARQAIPKEPESWEKQAQIKNGPHAVLKGGGSGRRRKETPEGSSFCSAPGASHHTQGTRDSSPKPKQTRPILSPPQKLAKATEDSETRCIPGISITHYTM